MVYSWQSESRNEMFVQVHGNPINSKGNVCRKFKAFSFHLNNSKNVQYYDKYNAWLIYIIKIISPSELPSLLP